MRVVLFCHSLISDWNHGNAHFLRGIAAELIHRGHDIRVFEPRDAWSSQNLLVDAGEDAIREFHKAYPKLGSTQYDPRVLDLDAALEGANLVIVHEWNSHQLVKRIGEYRREKGKFALLFHDTHHRAVTDSAAMRSYDLSHYDGALVFGESLRSVYLSQGLARRVWTWHEAADTRMFHTLPTPRKMADLVWIGNWGDEERTAELREFLLEPVQRLGICACAYGVRYPAEAIAALGKAGIEYRGWAPNFRVPEIYAQHRLTVHIPRRPYATALPGIPTIRVFEALACGIPLISAPWNDSEGLFTAGEDFLVASNGEEMKQAILELLSDSRQARALALHGQRTVLELHTCAHRVDELLRIHIEITSGSKVLRHTAREGEAG